MNLIASMLKPYRCHKVVHAAKIVAVDEALLTLTLELPVRGFGTVGAGRIGLEPAEGFFGKHRPEVGGYFVVYEDGYQSFSPAKAFEEGYTLVAE